MTDEFDPLKKLLAEAPPPRPRDAARQQGVAAALAAFDEENATSPQGSAQTSRHRVRQPGLMTQGWRRLMHILLPSTRTMMMGGASLTVVSLALFAAMEYGGPSLRDQLPVSGQFDTFSGGSGNQTATAPVRQRGDGEREMRAERDDAVTSAPAEPVLSELAAPPAPSMNNAPVGQSRNLSAPGRVTADAKVRVRKGGAQLMDGAAGNRSNEMAQIAPRPAAPPVVAPAPADLSAPTYEEQGRDRFEEIEPNRVKVVAEEPVSTFSIDVDTASYAFLRRSLMNGVLPQKDAIRVEELVNYFPYDYPLPETREAPFAADVAIMPTPWNEGTRLMRIGIQGYELAPAEKPRSNLVFLIDTSGSMNAPDKLPLLINSFRLLVESLDPDDTVSIVVYAGSAGTVLEPTPVSERAKILSSLERLSAGGSTAGGEGIRQAYRLAESSFDKDGINRVILATDGDFNVGITNHEELKGFVERKRESGVYLSVLGFGQGNYNDQLMQALAQNGNGNAAYIDTLSEARKTLVDEASSTLFPIAQDVKIQVEFNPATVAEYRLIGYETRLLAREDFNNDRIDAGEIGAGHSVTALYEITPVGSDARLIEPSRYGAASAPEAAGATQPRLAEDAQAGELAFLRIRWKQPGETESQLITRPVTPADERAADTEARFAAAVAGFGQLLRGGRYTGDFGYDDVIELANGAKGDDAFGYRAEFVNLVRLAKSAAALEPQK